MSRASVFLPASIVSFILFMLLSVNIPVAAAPPAQEGGIIEELRPGQDSYHGKEDIPFIPSSNPPQVNLNPTSAPVNLWSMITFQSYVTDNWEIYFGEPDFSSLVRKTSNDFSDIHPRLNRGATHIIFASDREDDIYEIFSVTSMGTDVVRLTNNAADDVHPVWSPDGTRIAFQSYRDGNSEIYVMNANGSAQTNLTHYGGYDGEPTWSPDGTRIAFTSYRNNQYRIWVMNVDGTNLHQLSIQPYSELPVWSPDGSKIAFDADSDYDDMMELWYMNSDGTGQTMLYDRNFNATLWANGWSPDNQWITFTNVRLVYMYGNWYWDYSLLFKISLSGNLQQVDPGYYTNWFLDWTTSDIQPPATSMSPLVALLPYQFTVTWSGQDSASGVKDFDVQVRDGLNGAWTDWRTRTTTTSAVFTGTGGHEYYFRTRARDNAFNTGAWPANAQAHTQVESNPPVTNVSHIDRFIRGNQIDIAWAGYDPGRSGISEYDVQYMDEATGIWVDWLMDTTATSAVFTGEIGSTYHFRSRGTDRAVNVEDWPGGFGDTSTSFYSWLTSGIGHDNTGAPVSGMNISIIPPAIQSDPSDRNGKFEAYVGTTQPTKTVTWTKDAYGQLPATGYGDQDAFVDVYLPPIDNIVYDSGFESGSLPGNWEAGGEFTPTLTSTLYHSGDYAASLGFQPTLGPRFVLSPVAADYTPVLFTDQQGGLHSAWTEGAYGYMKSFYYAQRLPSGSWLPIELIDTRPVAGQYIGMVVDDGLNIHILFGGYDELVYARRDPGGAWTTPQVLYPASQFYGVKIDNSSTIHALAFINNNPSYLRHEPGGAWEVETIPYMEFANPTFSIGTQGEVHIAWTVFSSHRVFYIQRKPDGSWTNLVTINRPGDIYNYISLVLASDNTPNLVWEEYHQLIYSKIYPDGTWTTPIDISDGAGGPGVDLFIDKNDTLYVLWMSSPLPEQIYFTRKDVQGEWIYPQNLTNSSMRSANPAGAVAPGGDIYVAWQEVETQRIFYSRQHAGLWSDPVQLSDSLSHSWWPDVVINPAEQVTIGWLQGGTNVGFGCSTTLPFNQSGNAWLSQSITIPISMTHPTLSFLATVTGISELSGNDFRLEVSTGVTTPTLFTLAPSTWGHYWFDMSPWSGQLITLTYQLTEHAGYPPAFALVDEVTIGSAHADPWVELSGGVPLAVPGDQVSYLVNYGNHGGVVASSTVITLTLPIGLSYVSASLPPQVIGQQLIWQLGDMPPGASFEAISLKVEVDSNVPMPQGVVINVEIASSSAEIETMNNSDYAEIYLGYMNYFSNIYRR